MKPFLPTVTVTLGLCLVSCEDPPAVTTAEPEAPALASVSPRQAPAGPTTVRTAENYELLGILYDLQKKVLELELEIATFHESYMENQFEDFLTLDPWELSSDQVYFLKHFCENGDFLLLKKAEALLLEREILRRRSANIDSVIAGMEGSPHSTVNDRLDRAMRYYEQRVADLEKVAGLFREASKTSISYPESVSPEQLERDRREVYARQEEIAAELAKLAEYLEELRVSFLGLAEGE